MSMKTIGWIITVLVVLAAAWYFLGGQGAQVVPGGQMGGAPSQTQDSQGGVDMLVRGSADASLDADLKTLDAQMQAASEESASVDQSFNDKPVEQTE